MIDSAWHDLKLFLHVASDGGLSGASLRTGLSAPTIGRSVVDRLANVLRRNEKRFSGAA